VTKLDFQGRSVIVTGAGRGIGRSHALHLASLGARVTVADLGGEVHGEASSEVPATDVVQEIRDSGGEAVACFGDVADERGAAAIIDTAMDNFGKIDAVINNAGIINPESFEEESLDKFRLLYEVHFMGTVNVTKLAWPHLLASGHGRVVNACSEGMLGIHRYMPSYGGAKGGVFGLTRALAADAAKTGIRVNGLAPRATTRMSTPETMANVTNMPVEAIMSRMPSLPPEQVAPVAAYLTHQDCTLNGEVLCAGAGQVKRLSVVLSEGIHAPDLSAEFVAENLDRLLDLSSARPVDVLAPPMTR
jgi:hypothetical protein